ncbi:TMEM175 family protein [Streptomyces mirabilis]|uniref:TMEM175 family protein n=1 Tax=Streptomyces mirabilis TaxID=68239 RepID=UPI00368E5D1A
MRIAPAPPRRWPSHRSSSVGRKRIIVPHPQRARLPCRRGRRAKSQPTGAGASLVPCPAAPALSDGIYAISMTLLVINVAIPAHRDDAAFHKALSDALPHLGDFALSFTLIAGFRRDHRRILTAPPTEPAVITRLTLLGLGLVALLLFPWPSSTRKQP